MQEISSWQAMLFCSVVSLLFALWFFFLAVSRVVAARSMAVWSLYLLVQSAGYLIIALRDSMPSVYALFPGVLSLLAAALILVRVYSELVSPRPQTRWILLILAACTVGTAYFAWVQPHYAARVVLSSGALAMASLHLARVLFQAARLDEWRIAGAVAMSFVVLAAAHLARLAAGLSAWSAPEPHKLPLVASPLMLYGPLILWSIVPSLGFLAMQFDRVRKEQQQDQQRTAGIVDSVDGIVWEADAHSFNFTFVSGKAERLLGYAAEEWLQPGFWTNTMHPDDRSWAPAYCEERSLALQPHEFEYRLLAKDGRMIWLRDIVTVEHEHGRPRWLRGIMVDITALKAQEEKLRRLTFMYELLSNCRRIIAQTNSESALFSAIVELCVANNYIRLAWIGLPDDREAHVNIAAAGGAVTDYLDDLRVSLSPETAAGKGPTGTSMREHHDVIVNYPDTLPADAWSERRRKFGLHSYAAISFRLSAVRTGSLNLYAAEEGFFTPEIVGLFDQLGADMSSALDRLDSERWRSFAEHSLRENQLLLDFALEATVDAVWDYDVVSGTARFFRHWEAMLGYDRGEIENDLAAWESHVHPDDLRSSNLMLEKYLLGQVDTYDMRIRVRNKDGAYLWIKNRGITVERDESGKATRIIGTLKNIDAEVRKAEESQQNAALLDTIFDTAPVAIAVLNKKRELVKANPAVGRIAGVTDDADLQHALSVYSFYDAEGKPYPEGTIPVTFSLPEFESNYSAVFGFRRAPSDPIRWISMTTRYLQAPELVVRISTDITDIIEAEQALRASEAKFRTLFEALPVGVSLHRIADRSLVDANRKMYEYSGLSREEFAQGKHLDREYLDADGVAIATADLPTVRAIVENRPQENLVIGFRDERGEHWFNSSVLPIPELGLYALISRDITLEKQQGEALVRSEQKFRYIFDNAPVGITLFDLAGNPTALNPEVLRQSAIEEAPSVSEIANWHFIDEEGNPLPLEEMPLYASIRQQKPVRNFIFGREFPGKVRWFSTTMVPMTDIGMFAGYLVELTDLVNAKREVSQLAASLEEKVARRTRELQEINAELEAFSYSLSHDLKAPLMRTESWLNILQHEMRQQLGEKGEGYLAYIRNEMQAMKRMNEAMLALSRAARSSMTIGEVSISRKALEIVQQLREENPAEEIQLEIANDPLLYADAELVRILLRNLLENAVKFSRGRKPVRIEIGCEAQADEVVCYVRDNGVGFDMEYADRLFAPFQRLHSESEFPGTGIGLATAQRIVHRHGGSIWAESAPEKGTTVYFTLPRVVSPL